MPRPRTPSKLSESLDRQVNSYALAAGAAGVGLLALAQPAEGKIVYTRAHQVISLNTSFNVDLNHDGTTDFVIGNKSHSTFYLSYDKVYVKPAAGNGFVGPPCHVSTFFDSCRYVADALKRGTRVGPGDRFVSHARTSHQPWGTMATAWYRNGSFALGPWLAPEGLKGHNRYLGFRFTIHGQAHYGWARLSVNSQAGLGHLAFTGLLTGYAYETIPNKPIIAGKTKGPDVTTVEPASLGRLARGSLAIPAWRKAGGER